MGLLGSLFSAAADIAKETITETMNQNETEKFIKIMMERDAQNAEANEKLYQDWLTHERSNYFAAKKNTIIHDAFDVLMDSFEDIVKDVKAAIYWYEKAANQGSVYAMYRAGYIYYSEPIDYNKAGQWFSLAAEKGDKDAEEVLRNNLRYNRFTKKWDAVR